MSFRDWPDANPGETGAEYVARLRTPPARPRPAATRMTESSTEDVLLAQVQAAGLPEPIREYLFAEAEIGRQWRFDFAWLTMPPPPDRPPCFVCDGSSVMQLCPRCVARVSAPGRRPIESHRFGLKSAESQPRRLALEIDGEVHRIRNRHRGDMEKFNVASAMGWMVLHFSPRQVTDGMALDALLAIFGDTGDLLEVLQRKTP